MPGVSNCVWQVLAKGLGKMTEAEQWIRQDCKVLEKAHKAVCPCADAICSMQDVNIWRADIRHILLSLLLWSSSH